MLNALNTALQQRRPISVIHHSGQGSQYTSLAFGQRYQQAGVRSSMGSVGIHQLVSRSLHGGYIRLFPGGVLLLHQNGGVWH